jgi:hypothetical protein
MTAPQRAKTDLRPWMRRLRNPVTGAFLHLSGQGETRDQNYAWSGTADQARNLRAKLHQGQQFPYLLIPFTDSKKAFSNAEHI